MGNPTWVAEQVRASGWEHFTTTMVGDLRHAVRRLRQLPDSRSSVPPRWRSGSAPGPLLSAPYIQSCSSRCRTKIRARSRSFPTSGRTARRSRPRSAPILELGAAKPIVRVAGVDEAVAAGDGRRGRTRAARRTTRERSVLPCARCPAGHWAAISSPPTTCPTGPCVVIVGDGLWRRRLGADPTIAGREIRLDDVACVVIGVMPHGFENVPAASAEIWSPLQYSTLLKPDAREWGHHLRMIGRLRAGVAVDQARQELNRIAHTPEAVFPRVPWASLERGLIVRALQDDVTRGGASAAAGRAGSRRSGAGDRRGERDQHAAGARGSAPRRVRDEGGAWRRPRTPDAAAPDRDRCCWRRLAASSASPSPLPACVRWWHLRRRACREPAPSRSMASLWLSLLWSPPFSGSSSASLRRWPPAVTICSPACSASLSERRADGRAPAPCW